MLLSAMTLAALLQAAPAMATAVVIPEAAPVAGHTGYLFRRKPSDTDQRVDQLRMRLPKAAGPKAADEAGARRFASPSSKMKPPRRSRPDFVRNPQMASCDRDGLTNAGHPDTPEVQPLSKMPKAHAERAVVRLVDGCPVPVLIAQRTPAR